MPGHLTGVTAACCRCLRAPLDAFINTKGRPPAADADAGTCEQGRWVRRADAAGGFSAALQLRDGRAPAAGGPALRHRARTFEAATGTPHLNTGTAGRSPVGRDCTSVEYRLLRAQAHACGAWVASLRPTDTARRLGSNRSVAGASEVPSCEWEAGWGRADGHPVRSLPATPTLVHHHATRCK
jgi:hypothetical protein